MAIRLNGTDPASQRAIVQAALDEFGRLAFHHSNLAGGTEGYVVILNCAEASC